MSTFKALRCDFCNGGLIIDDSREFAVCEFCGTKYMASTLRAKIQEIRGTVKVEGAVETTIGSSEKDRLLKNANAFYRIGEIEKALKEYGAIQDKFPECVDAWKNSLEIIVNEGLCATGPSNYAETIVKEIIRHCRVLERLMGERFSIKYYRDIFFNNICKGKIFILFQTGMVNPFDVLKPFLLK